ncbi:FAD-NAD(P)-binding [Arthrobacter alpinus]|uniref:FAD-NAD(P)-binding n=1 Tax=Arthrobacter alpinus TaxID=656366 RepID=A0A1H5FGA8_9MICC|nr:FAD/NAD(P)-binding protein [Arthrobacter alpinus]SEE02423.1 FAD-NAD(P)-binding [Arthrobacter alpinus]
MPRHDRNLVFIGGGPRTAGILERLGANAAELSSGSVNIHVVEPFRAGSGRIWRFDQDPGLMLNSTAGDVTMFTDASVVCAGPVADGPDLAQWAAAITAGTLSDAPKLPHHLKVQAAELTRASFPTRQLNSAYLEWFFRRAVAALAPHATVTIHHDTARVISPSGDGGHVVTLAGGARVEADAVVLAVGHSDAKVHGRSAEFATFAARHGRFHAAPAYTTDVDYSALTPGEDVIVSGMGLAFVDLVVLLMEGRGGRFIAKDDGELDYVPSGREPRLWAGSRRGVPYHSKISATLRGEALGPAPFFTEDAVTRLLAKHSELDFRTHLWPLIAKDTAHAYYQELFTGNPEQVNTDWAVFSSQFARLDWYSPDREALVASAVPERSLWLDFEQLDHPLASATLTDQDSVRDAVMAHIVKDLRLRDGDEHPETLALFLGLLRAYMNFAAIVPAERLTAGSHAAVQGWWHGFFSFVDSGPPPHRLRQILAIHRAGLLEFLGPGLTVATEEATGLFVATAGGGVSGIKAAAFIEARLPAPTVVNSDNPVLTHLHGSGGGTEQHLLTADGTVSTGRLLVTASHQVVGPSGEQAKTLFAVGPGTSAWGSGAFARPNSNAAPFRDNDALARLVLHALAEKTDLTLLSGRTQS